jgi:hypothetical protein
MGGEPFLHVRPAAISGEEAERIGLVSLSVADEELEAKSLAVAKRLTAALPSAVRWTKCALSNWLRGTWPIFASGGRPQRHPVAYHPSTSLADLAAIETSAINAPTSLPPAAGPLDRPGRCGYPARSRRQIVMQSAIHGVHLAPRHGDPEDPFRRLVPFQALVVGIGLRHVSLQAADRSPFSCTGLADGRTRIIAHLVHWPHHWPRSLALPVGT